MNNAHNQNYRKGSNLKNKGFKFPPFLIGLGIGAATAFMLALRMNDNTRNYISETANKRFGSLNEHARKLRESADKVIEKGRQFVNRCARSSDSVKEGERQEYEENKREHMGG